jgi:hypothetical protein
MLIILALSGLLAAILLSYPNKAILEKRDRPYSIISATAALASIALCIILSYFSSSPRCIFISILAGEFLNLLGLVKLCGTRQSLASRMVIWSRYLLMMTIPLLVRVYWGDSPTTFFAGMGMMAAVFLLLFRKKLRL